MSKPANKLLKHSTIYAIGTLSRQLVSFLMLPIYTHYMTPADYGVVGLLTFTLALMEPFFGARLGDAVPKFYFESDDPIRRRAVLSVALTITGLISGVTAAIIFLCRNPASQLLFGSSNLGLAVGLFGFQIITQALEYYGLTFIRMQQRPFLFITISLAKLTVQLGMNIWLIAFLRMGVMGVVISSGISSTIFAVGLSIFILKSNGYKFDLKLSKQMLVYSWPLWFSGLAGLYIWQSNRYYIRIFGSLDQIGLFELALKFSGILTFLVWSPFSQVWDVERFNYYKRKNAEEFFSAAFQVISVALIAAGLGISIFAKPIIQIMSSKEFHSAAFSVPFLTLGSAFSCLVTFLNFSFLATGNTKQISWNNYIVMALITVFNISLIPVLGETGAAIAFMLAMMTQFFLTERMARRYYDMNIRLKPFITTLLIATLGYAASIMLLKVTNLWIDVPLKAAMYLLIVLILGNHLLKNLYSHNHMPPFIDKIYKKFTKTA